MPGAFRHRKPGQRCRGIRAQWSHRPGLRRHDGARSRRRGARRRRGRYCGLHSGNFHFLDPQQTCPCRKRCEWRVLPLSRRERVTRRGGRECGRSLMLVAATDPHPRPSPAGRGVQAEATDPAAAVSPSSQGSCRSSSVRPTISSRVRAPSDARIARTSSATKRKKCSTISGAPRKCSRRRMSFCVATPVAQEFRCRYAGTCSRVQPSGLCRSQTNPRPGSPP